MAYARFVHCLYDDPAERGTVWLRLRLRLEPASLSVRDLSSAVAR
ncbi:hypothetical protein ACQEV2_37475 [Streptomyces sp. CA-251387]